MAFYAGSPIVVVTLGQHYPVGEKPTVILYTVNRHAGTPKKIKTKYTMSLDYNLLHGVQERMGVDEEYLLRNRKSASTGAVALKVVPVRGAVFVGKTMKNFLCASLSHTTYYLYVVDTYD